MATASSSKSGVSATPVKPSPCNCALMPYMTKPGNGASTCAPGRAQARATRLMSSSEPLPKISAQPSGMPACRASASRSTSVRGPG